MQNVHPSQLEKCWQAPHKTQINTTACLDKMHIFLSKYSNISIQNQLKMIFPKKRKVVKSAQSKASLYMINNTMKMVIPTTVKHFTA